jgi:DNA-binding transcriptional regulator YiaG
MMIDEKATIGSILKALSIKGVQSSDIAKQITGINEKVFRNALKEAGYEFRNFGQKGWYFVGEGKEPLDKSIFDFVKRSSPTKKNTSHKVHKEDIQSNTKSVRSNINFKHSSHEIHEQLTQDEIRMIREMLKSWQEVSISSTVQAERESLYERIKQLPQGKKTRKTIVINSDIGKRLDEICKAERVNKSDVLHLALVELFRKYEK